MIDYRAVLQALAEARVDFIIVGGAAATAHGQPTQHVGSIPLRSQPAHRGLGQRELAACLGVHEPQVSRDERNEYRSISVERAERILEALEVELVSELRPAEGS